MQETTEEVAQKEQSSTPEPLSTSGMSTVRNNGGMEGLTIPANELRQFLQGLRMEILKDVDIKLFNAIDGLVGDLEHRQAAKKSEKVKNVKDGNAELPEKQFVCRNSLLTDLWNVPHLQSVYNICLALLVLLILNTAIFYCFDLETMKKDISTVMWAAGKPHIWALIWLGMKLSTVVLVYPLFRFWAQSRLPSRRARFYDYCFLHLFLSYQGLMLFLPVKAVLYYELPPISSYIILLEQIRIMMKVHAFVRENATRAFIYKPHQDGERNNTKPYPELQKLLFFLFAPTLVYRDNYPRTPYIRWTYVLSNFVQFLGCIFCSFVPFNRFVIDIFHNIGIEQIPVVNFMLIIFVAVLVGALSMFLIFYGLLHCWLNLFAEMFCFGDRLFYQDWWNCTSFAKYYRTWNMVVYDWLYTYVYRDIYMFLGKARVGAMIVVFLVSAIVHEYILAFTFGFLYPVLFVLFISFGMILVFVTRRKTSAGWNVFMWFGLFQGWGLLIVLYSMEWYARVNCPQTLSPLLDFVVPRSWTCNIIKSPWS